MFRFEEPIYLYLLAIIPLLAVVKWMLDRQQKKRLIRFGDPQLLKQLMPDVSKWRPTAKFWLMQAALTLLIVMLARPQMGTRVSNEKRTGIETIIAMDISNSMLAEDVAPSRLDRTKMMVENLVDNFTDDKIGLIVFAGEAFVQLPITSDYVSAKMFLSDITPSLIASQGTDIATAINMAVNSLTQQQGVGKAIIVVTDGEDHEGGAEEAAKAARKKGMRVYVLGVGSPDGSPIPLGNGEYMKDKTGNTVMTKLNEDMCRTIAQAGGGAYIHVNNNSNAQQQLNFSQLRVDKHKSQHSGETMAQRQPDHAHRGLYSCCWRQGEIAGQMVVILRRGLIRGRLVGDVADKRLSVFRHLFWYKHTLKHVSSVAEPCGGVFCQHPIGAISLKRIHAPALRGIRIIKFQESFALC